MFDKRNSGLKSEIVAICPILHRVGDFGGEAVKYPMFWVKYSDVRPYMAQQYIITSSENNVRNYTFDDFFKLRMFDAEIYKTMNLRNMSLMQLYPEQAAQDSARREIEKQLQNFENGLWVKDIEEINKEKEAKAIEEAKTEEVKSDKPKEAKSSIDSTRSSRGTESPKSSVSKSTKSTKSVASKSSSKSSRSKASKSSAPVRSVRSTK